MINIYINRKNKFTRWRTHLTSFKKNKQNTLVL